MTNTTPLTSWPLCTRPLEEIVILSDGRVTTCCIDPWGFNAFANIYQDDFTTTISKFQQFKQHFIDSPSDFQFCHNCFRNRQTYYNDFHIHQPSPQDIQDYLSPQAIPRRLVIEPISICNLSCLNCVSDIKTLGKFRSNHILDLEKTKIWLTPHITSIGRIRFYNYGETFLNKNSIAFCAFLRHNHPHIEIDIATNLLPLDNHEKIQALVNAQPNILKVSLHGADQEKVSRYMGPKANFQRAIEIMKDIISFRTQKHYSFPLVMWKYLLFEWNDSDEEIEKARLLSKENGIDFFALELANGPYASRRFAKGTKKFNQLQVNQEHEKGILKRLFKY